jgi:hypothetical protein
MGQKRYTPEQIIAEPREAEDGIGCARGLEK